MLNKKQDKAKVLPSSEVTKIMEQIELVIFDNEMTASFIDQLIESLLNLSLCKYALYILIVEFQFENQFYFSTY